MSLQQKDVCEEKVFNELFIANSKDLNNFLYYKYGDGLNPKDVVQEAFIKMWDNCKTITFNKARSFLFTVANNHVLNQLSKEKTAEKYRGLKHKDYTHENPEYLMEEHEYMQQLEDALNSLTEDLRVTFLMNRVEGKKHQEIADMLGISRKAVEKRIYKALSIVREKVKGI